MKAFQLRFPLRDVRTWAQRYSYGQDETLFESMRSAVARRGYLDRSQFLAVCRWKTPRSRPRCAQNEPASVRETTRLALSRGTPDHMKIEMLTLLSGVGWPTASVILHMFDARPYPILDYRALWSVGQDVPSRYTYDFWSEYTLFTRRLARSAGCDMRTLDRALWQYSKERQPGG